MMSFKALQIGKHKVRHPIVQGGMGLGISWDRLASAVSLNGGLGVISSVGTGYYENRSHIKKELNARPYGSENFYSREGLQAVINFARAMTMHALPKTPAKWVLMSSSQARDCLQICLNLRANTQMSRSCLSYPPQKLLKLSASVGKAAMTDCLMP